MKRGRSRKTWSISALLNRISVILLIIVPLYGGPLRADTTSSGETVVWVDTSSSMSGERIAAALEAAKLMVFIADGPLVIGRFSDSATVDRVFQLPAERDAALRAVDRLLQKVDGGTQYIVGLRLCPASSRVIVWLSDGEPSDDTEAVQFVRDKIRCPIHAVAFQAAPGAYQTLSRMAAASQGAAHNVATAEQLAESFLAIHEQIRQSRRAEGKGRLTIPQVQGEVLAIGIGAEPSFDVSSPANRHVATVAGEQIHAARVHVDAKRDVEVTLPGGHERDRLIVIRYDLPRAVTKIESAPVLGKDGPVISGRTRFQCEGRLFDPRQPGAFHVQYELIDAQGQVVSTTEAQPAPDQPEFRARIPVAAAAGQTGWHLRTTTRDERGRVAFVERQLRTLDVPEESSSTPALDELPDLLRLRVVAHRSARAVVIFDSAANARSETVLVGDPLSLELLAGTGLSAAELLTLGQSLKAEFIGEDGAVRAVPLEYRDGRFVTAPVPMPSPGRLRVQVRVDVQGVDVKIEGAIEIVEPRWQLLLDDPSRGLGMLPQYASVPYRVAVRVAVGGRPATRDEFVELVKRHNIALATTRTDSIGRSTASNVVDGETLLNRPDSLVSGVRYDDLGEQTVAFALQDAGGQVLAETRLRLSIVEPPILAHVTDIPASGVPWLLKWLPEVFLSVETPTLVARPTDSPLSRLFFVAGVSLDDTPLPWRDDGFTAPLGGGEHQLRARLERYRVAKSPLGPQELQLEIPVVASESRYVNWSRLACAGLALAAFVGGVLWLAKVLSVLLWDACAVELWGGLGDLMPLKTCWWFGVWPVARLVVYRHGEDDLLGIGTGEATPGNATIVAQLERTGRHQIHVEMFADAKRAIDGQEFVLDDNTATVSLGSDVTLIANFGAKPQTVLA